jgi:hypothetical protein
MTKIAQEPNVKSAEKIEEINQMVNRINLQDAILTEVDSINSTIDFLFTRDNCLVDNKNFAIMNITNYGR